MEVGGSYTIFISLYKPTWDHILKKSDNFFGSYSQMMTYQKICEVQSSCILQALIRNWIHMLTPCKFYV
jgi:hypothetical protein